MAQQKRIFKDWKTILILFIVSVTVAYISFQFDNEILKFLNIISWCVLSFYLYKNIFGLINLLDMSNDLLLWISRIVGVVIGFIGLFMGGTYYFVALLQDSTIFLNSSPLNMGVSIIFFGLGFLGGFMVFRTKRRYPHLYINR